MKNPIFKASFLGLALAFHCSKLDFEETKEPPPPPPPPRVTVPFPEAMFEQNGCASCHGKDGDGRATLSSNGYMPNFQDKSTYRHGSSLPEILNSIKKGVPGTQMRGYPHLQKEEWLALAQHILGFQKK